MQGLLPHESSVHFGGMPLRFMLTVVLLSPKRLRLLLHLGVRVIEHGCATWRKTEVGERERRGGGEFEA